MERKQRSKAGMRVNQSLKNAVARPISLSPFLRMPIPNPGKEHHVFFLLERLKKENHLRSSRVQDQPSPYNPVTKKRGDRKGARKEGKKKGKKIEENVSGSWKIE